MALDPGLGLLLSVLAVPSVDAPATPAIEAMPVQFDLTTLSAAELGWMNLVTTRAPSTVTAPEAPNAAEEQPYIAWNPAPMARIKIDPAGLRFNYQF